MDLFHCGKQWGYTPMGRVANIPPGYCNPPYNLTTSINFQYVTFTWNAPHDFLYFELEYRLTTGPGAWTTINVYGTSYLATLLGMTGYDWRVRTVCEAGVRFSTWVNGESFTTGKTSSGCSAVSTVSVTILGKLGWNIDWADTGAAWYEINIFDTMNGGSAVHTASSPTNTYFLPRVLPVGNYAAYVTAHCFDGSTAPVSPGGLFMVFARACPEVSGINYTAGETSMAIVWAQPVVPDKFAGSYTYNIYLDDQLIVADYPNTMFTFSGLIANTEYSIDIRTNCPEGGFSEPVNLTAKTKVTACTPPTALVLDYSTATTFGISWAQGNGISQELVLNNGDIIPLTTLDNSYAFFGLPSGSLNKVVLRGVCADGNSNDIEMLVQLSGCAAISNLVLSYDADGMHAVWDTVANAVKYIVGIDINGAGMEYFDHDTAVYILSTVTKGDVIDVSVKAVCMVDGALTEGTAATDSITIALDPAGNCKRYIITEITTLSATELRMLISPITGEYYGRPIRVVAYGVGTTTPVIATGILNSPGYITLTASFAAGVYDIYAYSIESDEPNIANPLLDGCTLNTPTAFTFATCWVFTSANFNLSWTDPDILNVGLTGTSFTGAQTTINIDIQEYGSDEWISQGNVAIASFPLAIPSLSRKRYRVRAAVLCNSTPMDAVISDWICPDTPNLTFTPDGTNIILTEVDGSGNILVDENVKYYVTLTSISRGTTYHTISHDDMVIRGLYPSTVYTADVQILCSEDPVILGAVRSYTFVTGIEVDNSCAPPVFMASIQDCNIKNPIESGGGGGSTTCALESAEWSVNTAFFIKDPANNLSTNYYFEALLSFSVAVIPTAEILFPGGIAATITTPACRPNIISSMDVALISGSSGLITAAAQISNDGNLTITGSATADGGNQIVLKISGIYTYA